MTPLLIHLPGAPVGKARPAPRKGTKKKYIPTSGWEQEAAQRTRWAMRRHGGAFPLIGPVCVEVHAVKARPQALLARKHPDGRILRDVKPDADNVAKSVLDALEKAGIFEGNNDAKTAQLHAHSLYAARGEAPCVDVRVTRATTVPAPFHFPEPS